MCRVYIYIYVGDYKQLYTVHIIPNIISIQDKYETIYLSSASHNVRVKLRAKNKYCGNLVIGVSKNSQPARFERPKPK